MEGFFFASSYVTKKGLSDVQEIYSKVFIKNTKQIK
jgi:hypothetical protein